MVNQLHAPAALSPRKEPAVLTGWEVRWPVRVVWTWRESAKLPSLAEVRFQSLNLIDQSMYWYVVQITLTLIRAVCPLLKGLNEPIIAYFEYFDGFLGLLFVFFFPKKFIKKIQVSLKSDENNRDFTVNTCVGLYLAQFSFEWEMFQTKVVEKIKTHIVCSVTFFRKPCPFMR